MKVTKEEMIEAFIEALEAKRTVPKDTHTEHHAFIELMMKREERRAELWQKFKSSIIGGIALAILAGLGWIGTLILEFVRHGK